MTFVGLLPQIQSMAHNMIKYWGHEFVVDELVNEAWIKSLRYRFSDTLLIMRRAKMDMIDYLRKQIGRKEFFFKGERIPRKKPKPRLITNVDSIFREYKNSEEGHIYNFLDSESYDKDLLKLENTEIIDHILAVPTERQAAAIKMYYFGHMTLKQIGAAWGRSECTAWEVFHKGINKCREKMELVEV